MSSQRLAARLVVGLILCRIAMTLARQPTDCGHNTWQGSRSVTSANLLAVFPMGILSAGQILDLDILIVQTNSKPGSAFSVEFDGGPSLLSSERLISSAGTLQAKKRFRIDGTPEPKLNVQFTCNSDCILRFNVCYASSQERPLSSSTPEAILSPLQDNSIEPLQIPPPPLPSPLWYGIPLQQHPHLRQKDNAKNLFYYNSERYDDNEVVNDERWTSSSLKHQHHPVVATTNLRETSPEFQTQHYVKLSTISLVGVIAAVVGILLCGLLLSHCVLRVVHHVRQRPESFQASTQKRLNERPFDSLVPRNPVAVCAAVSPPDQHPYHIAYLPSAIYPNTQPCPSVNQAAPGSQNDAECQAGLPATPQQAHTASSKVPNRSECQTAATSSRC